MLTRRVCVFVLVFPTWLASAQVKWFGAENLMDKWRNNEMFFKEWDVAPFVNVANQTNYLPVNGDKRMLDLDFALSTSFSWEAQFWGPAWTSGCRQFWWLAYVAVGLYLVGMWMGGNYMSERKPFDLKGPLNAWNLFLAVFSLIGALRTVPHLLGTLSTFGIEHTLCRAASVSYGSGACGLWVMLFIFSKYFELIDTVFLVLRKRKVGFLHWYHHMTVLLYCWHSYTWEMPTGLYFVAMNYSVHALMYFYYFLSGISKPPKWGLLVTIIQLTQMMIGIAVTLGHITLIARQKEQYCDGYLWNLTLAFVMYGSYFALFAQFFIQRYCNKRPQKKSDASKKER